MNDIYGQKSEREASRGGEKSEELRLDANSGQDARRASTGSGNQRLALDRKSSTEGIGAKNAIGGIIDQLIEDTHKQLGKSRECVIWYQAEIKEFEEKLKNLTQLKELQEDEEQVIDDSEDERLG